MTLPQPSQDTIPPDQLLPALLRSNMLRMVLTKHIELNKSADTKAGMLVTAASIVVAVIFSSRGVLSGTSQLVLMVTSLLAIVFSMVVILPKPYHRNEKTPNLLYFRSFNRMSEDEYVDAMKHMMADKNRMYEQYIRDIYRYGNVTLTRKYRWLMAGLLVFLLGLLIAGGQWSTSFLNLTQ